MNNSISNIISLHEIDDSLSYSIFLQEKALVESDLSSTQVRKVKR